MYNDRYERTTEDKPKNAFVVILMVLGSLLLALIAGLAGLFVTLVSIGVQVSVHIASEAVRLYKVYRR